MYGMSSYFGSGPIVSTQRGRDKMAVFPQTTGVDPDLCHHMASLGHNELNVANCAVGGGQTSGYTLNTQFLLPKTFHNNYFSKSYFLY